MRSQQLPRELRILTEVLGVTVEVLGPDSDETWLAYLDPPSLDWLDGNGPTREAAVQDLNKKTRRMAMGMLRGEYTFER